MAKQVIHRGDAGKGAISCGAEETSSPRNWVWKPEDVTCKKCLKIYRDKIRKRERFCKTGK